MPRQNMVVSLGVGDAAGMEAAVRLLLALEPQWTCGIAADHDEFIPRLYFVVKAIAAAKCSVSTGNIRRSRGMFNSSKVI